MKWLFSHFSGCVTSIEVVEQAAHNGNLEILKFLLENDAGRYCEHSHILMNIEGGDDIESYRSVPIMPKNWMGPGNAVTWGGRSLLFPNEGGYSEVIRWLFTNTPHHNNESEVEVAIHNSLFFDNVEQAKFLLPPGKTLLELAGTGCTNLEVIKMALDAGLLRDDEEWAASAFRLLVDTGRLDLMQQIAQMHSPPTGTYDWEIIWYDATTKACTRGDLRIVKWLEKHPVGRSFSKHLKQDDSLHHYLGFAAEAGHVEVMQFLFDHGDADNYGDALIKAVRNNHLDAVKWLLRRLPLSESKSGGHVIEEAADLGRLEILQFLNGLDSTAPHTGKFPEPTRAERKRSRKTGTWWTQSRGTMSLAARSGHLDVVQWLYVTRVEGCSTDAMDLAATNGHLDVVKWLHSHRSEGCTKRAMDGAAANGHLEIVQWLHHNRSEGCTTRAMDLAAAGGKLEVLKWLFTNRSEGCTNDALERAIEQSHVHVAWWLHQTFPDFYPKQNFIMIHMPNQFDMSLFLREYFPAVYDFEDPDHPIVCVMSPETDEYTRAWQKEKSGSTYLLDDLATMMARRVFEAHHR